METNAFYLYTAKFWDAIDLKPRSEHGMLAATSYVNAVARLCEYYGDDLMNFSIEEFSEEPVIVGEKAFEGLRRILTEDSQYQTERAS